jgi:uncharacterized membrane protein YphA (DoxX/SURF4 family)
VTDLKLAIDERRTFGDVLLTWGPRIAIALLFIAIGRDKFRPDGMWVRVFELIGFGQWFRYATGILQIGGALLLLVPRTAWVGAAVLACTMLGAVLTDIFVMHSIVAIVPAVLLGIVVTVDLAALPRA